MRIGKGGQVFVVWLAVAGCTEGPASSPAALRPPRHHTNRINVGRFLATVTPHTGGLEIFRVTADGHVLRDAPVTAGAVYDYGAPLAQSTCTGAACLEPDTVSLFTEGDVTYVESGKCFRDGATLPDTTCGGLYPADHVCAQDRVFCGPIRLWSDIRHGAAVGALPNVVVDIDTVTRGTVDTCRDNRDGDLGTCARSGHTNPAKINPLTSDFVPAIRAGRGPDDAPCALCYGNNTAIGGPTGPTALRNAVMSGTSTALSRIQTNTVALHIPEDWDSSVPFEVTFDVVAATPTLEPPRLQVVMSASDGTPVSCLPYQVLLNNYNVTLFGASFGPPAVCFSALFMDPSCSSSPVSAAASGYVANLFDVAGPLSLSPTRWSDGTVNVVLPQGRYYGCGVGVTTPMGSVMSSIEDNLRICSNQWRSWTGAAGPTRGAAAALGSDLVQVGNGRVTRMAAPRCAAPSPTVVTELDPPPPEVAETAHAYAALERDLFIFGGSTAGVCTNHAARMEWNAATQTGTWHKLAVMPEPLCGAAAALATDTVTGTQYIVIAGGLSGTTSALSPRIYLYDVAADAYLAPVDGLGLTIAVDGKGATLGGDAVFAGGRLGVSPVTAVTRVAVASGTPTVSSLPALPVGVWSRTAIAVLGGQLYAYVPQASSLSGTASMFRMGATSWTSMLLPSNRDNNPYLLTVTSSETDHAQVTRLIVTGSLGGGLEYNP